MIQVHGLPYSGVVILSLHDAGIVQLEVREIGCGVACKAIPD